MKSLNGMPDIYYQKDCVGGEPSHLLLWAGREPLGASSGRNMAKWGRARVFSAQTGKVSEQYAVGDMLAADVFTVDGRLLIPKGTLLTDAIYRQILKWEEIGILTGQKPKAVTGAGLEMQYESLKKVGQEQVLFQHSIETVRDVFLDMREGHGFNEGAIRDTTAEIVSSIARDEKIGLRLSRLWDTDDYTLHHSVDVCLLSTMIGMSLGLSKAELESLAVGAILHDIGKIYIPDEILNKRGKLTDEEFALIRTHPEAGMKVFQESGVRLPEEQMACILQHQEWCNGKGYPNGLRYAQIHLFARIVAVADVYSALTTNRSYRGRLDHINAVSIISSSARDHLDKHIVFVFIDRLRDLMLNTRVRLSTGEEGYVVQFYEDSPLQPTVLVTETADGRKLVSPYLIHLKEKTDVFIQQVLFGKI
ncbi:HD domain-containing protein [Heliobacterium gestii]|uniref:HD domain-containing protein n=1 Tax=Heliomicrobium gestii TaxID=2699 RepID=A0A845L9Q1_HELGE|nr:HD-GYP domain-containing protein [Heliomicrobium gestii]MBM7868184.1 HD-GYP domain-containing protein (c-di-GMP phosphodiesterase class II) [Heliomicrobium gestii]MZP43382.1 HD domain-containing protein [Heliomicrobium gestii]